MLTQGGTVLGLDWGISPEEARRRLDLTPATDDDLQTYQLDTVVARVRVSGRFCPSILQSEWVQDDGALELSYQGGGLAGARVRFDCSFRQLGQRSDTLSDQAMVLLARGEFHRTLTEMVARYGPPAYVADEHARIANMHVVGMALFVAKDGGPIELVFGHRGASLAVEIRWLSAVQTGGGF
ncbi:MAG: hypothetical protein AAGK00_00840 [Pseudomonadota bacterium]